MSNTIQGAAITPETPLQASVAQGPVIINDYVIDLQEVPEGVQLTVRKGSEEQTAVIPMGGSGGVSSWNDLPDRPFGDETVTFINEPNLTLEDGGAIVAVSAIPNKNSVAIVKWNGDEYMCEVGDIDGQRIIGNALALGGSDTGEPFAVFIPTPSTAVVFSTDANATTASIEVIGQTTKKLDAKYASGGKRFYKYPGDSDVYLYTDWASGIKATKDDLLNALTTCGAVFSIADASFYGFVYADFDEDYAVVSLSNGAKTLKLYTAEYTPESTASE